MNLSNDLASISEKSSYSTFCPTLDRISFVSIHKNFVMLSHCMLNFYSLNDQ